VPAENSTIWRGSDRKKRKHHITYLSM
jgi:hypothetical protein